jgi:DNA-binding NarL/FixJ family response regulator
MNKNTPDSAARVVKVLIVDDHPAVREALAIRVRLEPDLEVSGEADDVESALQAAASVTPDLAVIDIALKTGNGIDLIKRLKAHYDQLRMIVWSMYSEELFAERALRAGAMAYLTKDKGTPQIVEAIRDVLAGNMYLSASLTTKLLKRTVGQVVEETNGSVVASLSDRELEVFRLIGRGIKTNEIALQLHLSVNTVETYRDRIRTKLDLTDGLELARCAMKWFLDNG